MTLRRTIGRALHAMTTTGAPQGWEDDRGTITTAQAATALGLRRTPGLGATPNMAAMTAQQGEGREQARHVVDALVARDAVQQADTLRGMVAQRDSQLRDAQAELQSVLRALDAETRQRAYAEGALERQTMQVARLTRDVALRTTQRDKARSDRDRALTELEALRAEMDPPC